MCAFHLYVLIFYFQKLLFPSILIAISFHFSLARKKSVEGNNCYFFPLFLLKWVKTMTLKKAMRTHWNQEMFQASRLGFASRVCGLVTEICLKLFHFVVKSKIVKSWNLSLSGLQARGRALQVEAFDSYSAQILQVENGLKLVS